MLFIFENNLNFYQIDNSKSWFIVYKRNIFFSNYGWSKKTNCCKKRQTSSTKESKKGKKDKGEGGPKKAEITVMVNEQQAMKIIQNSKVVTVQDLARQTGVKISAANAFLKESASKGTVKRVGGLFRTSFVSSSFFIDTKYISRFNIL